MRVLKAALQHFFRNPVISSAMVGIMVLTLLLINSLLGVRVVATSAMSLLANKLDVGVYFKPIVKEERILALKDDLEKTPGIQAVRYTSTADALQSFRDRNIKNDAMLSVLEGLPDNPFPASLSIKTASLDDYQALLLRLQAPAVSELVSDHDITDYTTLIGRMRSITEKAEQGGLLAIVVFIFLSLLIVVNGVRMAVVGRREELSVMRLVGASNMFIRGPLLLEGVLASFFAVGIATGLFAVVLYFSDPYVGAYLTEGVSLKAYFMEQGLLIVASEFVVFSLLNMFVSLLAIRRYLKV